MGDVVRIDRRFRGPVASGNGGVSAGLAAALVGAPATVRLRRPPPIDVPLRVQRDDGLVRVVDDDGAVLEAREHVHPVSPPIDADVLERTFQRGTLPVPSDHLAPECFVCGPRPDGLRLAPRHLPGTELWTTVWVPDETVAGPDGTVMDHVVWGALDCPAGFAVSRAGIEEPTFFPALADLTASLEGPLPVGDPVAVVAWRVSADDRRVNGAVALVDEDGDVLASSFAAHARLPLDFALS